MNQGYNLGENGAHIFFDELTQSSVIVDHENQLGIYEKESQPMETGAITETDALGLIEAMKIPGTGLGMLLIKLGRAFERAIGGGSSAK
jgi:hypothetical protein